MADSPFNFVRLVGDERRVGTSLESVSQHWQGEKECFLFVGPHDDDIVLGGGLMILAALAEGIPVHAAIVTDGAGGYCSMEEKDTIADIRREETYKSFDLLGVPRENIHWLNFPDGQTPRYQGRFPAEAGSPGEVCGFSGMQNAFTKLLRDVRPTQVFLPTETDLHPDHKITHSEMMISLFHAAGDVWPELGEKIEKVPYVHELGVYCDFPSPPKLRLMVSEEVFEKKLQGILTYQSQKQIDALVNNVREAGAMEFYRPVEWSLYDPRDFVNMFEEPVLHHVK